MTVYRVEVSGPEPRTADDIALMLTSDDHYRTSDYLITVMRAMFDVEEGA